MVPEWNFGELDNLWYKILHHESTLFVIPELCLTFQLPTMIENASRTQLYLEDVDGS